MLFGSLLKYPWFSQGLDWTTSIGAFQPQLLCDSHHFGLCFAHSAAPPKIRTPMPPQYVPEGPRVFGKGRAFWDRGKWRRSRVQMQPNLINRTCLPLKHKWDWSITKKQHPAILKSVWRLKESDTAWENSGVISHGFGVQSLHTHNTPRHVSLGKYFHLDFVPQFLHSWEFHIYLQYSPQAVFYSFTLPTLVIMSALSMQWRNLKHVNTTGRCTDCISALFTSMITLYCVG